MRSVVGSLAGGGSVTVAWTELVDGDLAIGSHDVDARRRAVVDRPWVWAQQVHGAGVVLVDEGEPSAWCGLEADALVTRRDDLALAVQSADCATVGLWSVDGVLAAVHCGWRGLVAGVLAATVDAMHSCTTAPLRAVTGPSIGVECYEFGFDDRERVRAAVGDSVVGRTSDGRTALDVRGGVVTELRRLGVEIVVGDERCTACEEGSFHSHRARGDRGRQALVVWRSG